jgi:hypothetical protein
MHHAYTFIALDIANDRTREANDRRRAALIAAGTPERPSFARRSLAQALAGVSRGSAAAVRKLDDVVAEDLGRALAPGK